MAFHPSSVFSRIRCEAGRCPRTVSRATPLGFTLVELMVVVAIISLLMAMIVPAVEQAMYEAKLARCLAQLDGIAVGAHTYAMSNKTWYPVPPAGRRIQHQPDELAQPGEPDKDLRRVLEGYIPLDLLLCPLTGAIDLSYEANYPETHVYSPYALFFGREFKTTDGKDHPNGDGGLMRLGDRLGWHAASEGETWYFRVIASDLNDYLFTNKWVQTSHPDLNGRMENIVLQNGPLGDFSVTHSRWQLKRRKIDLNFAFTDGSAHLYRQAGKTDPRFKYSPTHSSGETDWRFYMPAD